MTIHNENAASGGFDSSALAKLRNGDILIFELLFRQYYALLVRFACHYVDRQVAQDLVQDLFAALWADPAGIKPEQNIKAYLYKATLNRALKHLRHAKVESRYRADQIDAVREGSSPEEALQKEEFRRALEKALQAMPDKCRRIFCMNRFDQLKYREIAEINGLSIKTVETQMGRALKFLRRHLQHLLLSLVLSLL